MNVVIVDIIVDAFGCNEFDIDERLPWFGTRRSALFMVDAIF